MIDILIPLLLTLIFLGLLFYLAHITEKGNSPLIKKIINHSIFYSLGLAVYCTDWTYYGSIGRAHSNLLGFLPVYLGPTAMAFLYPILLHKTISISKNNGLNSIADFLSARYDKSTLLGSIITIIYVLGVLPYISLQIKGIHKSFELVKGGLSDTIPSDLIAFIVTVILSIFSIIFGTRRLDTSERQVGLLSSVVFSAIIKLLAFLTLGIYCVWFVYNGHTDLLIHSFQNETIVNLISLKSIIPSEWITIFILSMFAILFLPHMFQVTVVENQNINHIKTASFVFPTYLFLINLFVIPILFTGILTLGNSREADTYALAIPIFFQNKTISYIVYIGGLAAAMGMAFTAIIAISTMVSNNLILPILIRLNLLGSNPEDSLDTLILNIRRGFIIFLFITAFFYYQTIGKYFSLVSIGLVSFAAVFQLVPIFLGGLFWKYGNKKGAISGLLVGFIVWAFTLPFPQMIHSGIFSDTILTQGLLGLSFLKPTALFGWEGLDMLTHSVFWSFLFNASTFIIVSLFSHTTANELSQSLVFVDSNYQNPTSYTWSGEVNKREIIQLLNRFLGEKKTQEIIKEYENLYPNAFESDLFVDYNFINYVESILAGSIGAASAKSVLSLVVKENSATQMEDMLSIIDESKKIKEYSEELKLLKQKQDGDYYLTSLLLRPLSFNDLNLNHITGEYYLKQNKEFEFRKWKSELGGDLCILSDINLRNKNYAFFINADAMGKSMQGAGGAIVLGSIFHSILKRTKSNEEFNSYYPEIWLKKSFIEAQRIFETFQGTMVISLSMGLIDIETGLLYYIIAEHPRPVLIRNHKAEFIKEKKMLMKLGIPDLEGKIQINCFQLQKGDILLIGSDGKDDIDLSDNNSNRKRLNEDENLFLRIAERQEGNIEKIISELNSIGKITDDLSLIRIEFQGETIQPKPAPENLWKEYKIIKQLIKKNEFNKAEEKLYFIYEQISIQQITDTIFLKKLGEICLFLKNFTVANDFFGLALKYSPADEDLLFYYSLTNKKNKNLNRAIDFAERLKAINPYHFKNNFHLMKIYIQIRENKKAKSLYEEMKKLIPNEEKIFNTMDQFLEKHQVAF